MVKKQHPHNIYLPLAYGGWRNWGRSGTIMTELSLDPYAGKDLSEGDIERLLQEEGRRLLGSDFRPSGGNKSKQLEENTSTDCK